MSADPSHLASSVRIFFFCCCFGFFCFFCLRGSFLIGFPKEKLVLVSNTLVFLRENLFCAQTRPFSQEKFGFGLKNISFSEEKLVLGPTTLVFLRKNWFWAEKHLFS